MRFEVADGLRGRVGGGKVRVVFERDERVEPAVDVDGAGAVAERAGVAEVVVDDRRVVDAVAAAHDRLVVDRVGEAEARAEVRPVGLDEPEVLRLEAALPGRADDRAEPPARRRVRHVRVEAAVDAARLLARAAEVVAQAEVQRQARRDLEVVLEEGRRRTRSGAPGQSSGC